jgi:hypothetical protein
MGITMSVISMNHEKLLVRQTEMQAKALFQQIVVTRRWVAEHGGIFIEELPWLSDNAFVKNPRHMDYRGKRYVKQNPSTITREL